MAAHPDKTKPQEYFVGVDVGTASVRAGLVTGAGVVEKTHAHKITVSNPAHDFYVQDSEEIWAAVCACVKEVTAGVPDKSAIRGLGFDATCSLVVLDEAFKPVCVSPTGQDRKNIIMWMDHRAKTETEEINKHPYAVLKYVGGRLSPEMQTPKLVWLKRNMPETWSRAAHFFDLPDYLTFRATGKLSRSLCSLVCKWTYVAPEVTGVKGQGWDEEYFKGIGLEDLVTDGFKKIGTDVRAPGEVCGTLTEIAAQQTGLRAQSPVGISLIDAHAGFLAMTAAGLAEGERMTGRLGLICGTSTCHLVLSDAPIHVSGVWGPYGGAVLPNTHLTEGGISASGALIDHIIQGHTAYKESVAAAEREGRSIYERLEEVLAKLGEQRGVACPSLLTPNLHLYPDFHGNRSPLADTLMTGMVCGLTLDSGEEALALMYLAAIQGLAYATRHILDALTHAGHAITHLLMCGGLCASKTYIQTHADVLGLEVSVPQQPSVILGAAMLGGAAAGGRSLEWAARTMGGAATSYTPRKELKRFHDKKFQVYLKMQENQKIYREIMDR